MSYSMLIGRYQGFHDGHKELGLKLISEGKKVVYAVRDTPESEKDPFPLMDRIQTIRDWVRSQGLQDKIAVCPIPDVTEVCYGRTPGWGIREIRLDEKIEGISGTKVREQLRNTGKL